jgi:hypothetical protein
MMHIADLEDKISKALDIAEDGAIDGDHHKMWVIDQMVRILAGDDYEQWVRDFEAGEDGPHTYYWDTGVAP